MQNQNYEIALHNFSRSGDFIEEIIEATDWEMFGRCLYLELRSDGLCCVHLSEEQARKDSIVLELPTLLVDWEYWEERNEEEKREDCKHELKRLERILKSKLAQYSERY